MFSVSSWTARMCQPNSGGVSVVAVRRPGSRVSSRDWTRPPPLLGKRSPGPHAPHSFPSSGPRGAPRPSRVKIGRGRSVSSGYFQTSGGGRGALHCGEGTVRFAKSGLILQVLFAAAHTHTNPTAKRRTQVLRERQRVRNRNELRLLLDGLAYPELGYRQHPNTWKKNGRRAAPARVRGANRYSLPVVLAGARKPCARRAAIAWR